MRNMKNRKAVSPVIATVILVAVAITVSVAVSYWMGGISSQYTQFEKIEIQSGYSQKQSNNWLVTLELKNSGSQTAAITTVFVNEVPLRDPTDYDSNNYTSGYITTSIPDTITGLSIVSGNKTTVYLWVSSGTSPFGQLTSGTTIDVKLHSAIGNDYIKLIKLV